MSWSCSHYPESNYLGMTSEEAKQLITKYNAGQCSKSERELLENWFNQLDAGEHSLSDSRLEQLGAVVLKKLPKPEGGIRKLILWPLIAAAAMVIIIGTWYVNPLQYTSIYSRQVTDIKPGGNKATLIFANGSRINLSDTINTVIVAADGVKYQHGRNLSGHAYRNDELQVLTTPMGGEYQVILSDGTKITLNAASSLEFPASFSGAAERRVQLTGEGFFEVAKDKAHPFIVNTNDQDVKVLGTTFNINAYGKTTRTTLVEGSVKVSSGKSAEMKTLKPGEISVLDNGGIKVQPADLALETAWKRGKIVFKEADLKSIMSTLERWYNIEVVYQSYPSESRFSGSVSRSKNISAVLNLIASTQEVRFKIQERRVVVMK